MDVSYLLSIGVGVIMVCVIYISIKTLFTKEIYDTYPDELFKKVNSTAPQLPNYVLLPASLYTTSTLISSKKISGKLKHYIPRYIRKRSKLWFNR